MKKKEFTQRELIDIYRTNVSRVLKDLRNGCVNEEDLDKLDNFCKISLALMYMVPVSRFRMAQANAEIMSFVHSSEETKVQLKDSK